MARIPLPDCALLGRAAVMLGLAVVLVWAGWVTREVARAEPPRIVTVRLAETMARFVDEAARAGVEPHAVEAASLAYLQAAEAAVAAMDREDRIVLVAEAVLAGPAQDATPEFEQRIAAALEQEPGR